MNQHIFLDFWATASLERSCFWYFCIIFASTEKIFIYWDMYFHCICRYWNSNRIIAETGFELYICAVTHFLGMTKPSMSFSIQDNSDLSHLRRNLFYLFIRKHFRKSSPNFRKLCSFTYVIMFHICDNVTNNCEKIFFLDSLEDLSVWNLAFWKSCFVLRWKCSFVYNDNDVKFLML